MRVLVIGSGGREHALCWAIAASPLLTKLWCAPGNPGIAQVAECVPIGVLDFPALIAFAQDNEIDLVIPGPEAPLVAGIADAMEAASIPCIGPSRVAAQLEGSKAFTKELCDAAGIPTAQWERFDDADAARAFVRRRGAPVVVKADGLAAGKGVVVADTEDAALAAIDAMMQARAFGDAGDAVVIEECLTGQEVSLFALCDGETALHLGAAQDHKRVGEGETGPNTGGMGSYSPTPSFPPALQEAAMDGIIRPALAEMARRGTPFRGILYAGLMLTAEGVKLIEFNVRFGDPECQALLPRLMSDLLPALQAAYDGELRELRPALERCLVDRGGDGGARLSGGAGARQRNPRPRPRRGAAQCADLPRRHRGGRGRPHPRRRRTRAQRVRHRHGHPRGARRRLCGDPADRLARGLLPPRHRLAGAECIAR